MVGSSSSDQKGKEKKRKSTAMNQVDQFVEGNYNRLGSDFVLRDMAEEESLRAHANTTNESGSTSKEDERGNTNTTTTNNSNWLQLSIGFNQDSEAVAAATTTAKQDGDRSGLVELELLPGGGRHSTAAGRSNINNNFGGLSPNLHYEQTTSSMAMAMGSGPISATTTSQETNMMMMMNWGGVFGPLPHSMPIHPRHHHLLPSSSNSNSSSSSHSFSLRPPLSSLPLGVIPTIPSHNYFQFTSNSSSPFDQYDVAPPPSSLRVVHPPPRPHSGIWFMLQASPNQAKEPFLPQIPKNYLRIKDGRMTVRLLLKYLVSKLRLDSESEIEITCRGQQLLPFLTLQHVRDNIWSPRDTSRPLLSDSSTTDHVMVLHYGRSTS